MEIPTQGYDLIRDEMVFAISAIFDGAEAGPRLQTLTETANRIRAAFAPMLE